MTALVAARFLPHGFARLRCGDCGHEQLCFVQRFGGLVNLNVHFHVVVPDGVFVKEEVGPVHFVEVGSPEDEDVLAVLKKVVRRVLRRLEREHRTNAEDEEPTGSHGTSADRRGGTRRAGFRSGPRWDACPSSRVTR